MPEAERLRQGEDQIAKLKQLLAEAMLDNAIPKEITVKNDAAGREAGNNIASR